MNAKEVTYKGTTWISITSPGEEEASFLREKMKFHPLDVEDCLSISVRSRVDVYPNYQFAVMIFPTFDAVERVIRPFEVDIFITKDRIITVQDHDGLILRDLMHLLEISEASREQLMSEGPVGLFITMVSRLLSASFPMVDHINKDIWSIEQTMFSANPKKQLLKIMATRRNLALFRNICQAHKHMIRKVAGNMSAIHTQRDSNPQRHFDVLVEHTKEIWDTLVIQKEELEMLSQTNESLLTSRLNDVMKNFTVLSVLILVLTLVTALFTMHFDGTPFLTETHGFWYVLGLEMILALIVAYIFRRKRWM